MFRNERIEMKVGLFIGAGIFLMFLLIFSLGDFYFFEDGYHLYGNFDFVSGITARSPVRYAGVDVGEVRDVRFHREEETGRTQVRVRLWIRSDVEISEDAVCRISLLGPLGEYYVEITPGISPENLPPGSVMDGRNPINLSEQMEIMSEVALSLFHIVQSIERGEGILGRLLKDDSIYDDIQEILTSMREGEGTVGRLLTDDSIYQELEELVIDIRRNPWKLLRRPSRSQTQEEPSRGTVISPR